MKSAKLTSRPTRRDVFYWLFAGISANLSSNMARRLSDQIGVIKGLGPKGQADLLNLGIRTFSDALWHIPFRFDDFSYNPPINNVRHGDAVTLTGRIWAMSTRPIKGRKLKLTEAILEDESGKIKLIWFNQSYIEKLYPTGSRIDVAGRVDTSFGRQIRNPVCEPVGVRKETGRMLPVYRLAGSLTQRKMRMILKEVASIIDQLEDWLSPDVLAKEGFVDLPKTLLELHNPTSKENFYKAGERLKFDELLAHQLLFQKVRSHRELSVAKSFAVSVESLKELVGLLPFILTNGQKQAIWEAVQDVAKPHPMNRLVQGDVGSGKTAVAGVVIAHTIKQGGKAMYLAPTELLTYQQAESLRLFVPNGKVAALTGSKAFMNGELVSRQELLDALNGGEIDLLVGTHALLSDSVNMKDPAVIVIDEQHRFGVRQRHKLLSQSEKVPHLLSLTATPIPRSLALTVYGDLDVSQVTEKPPGRVEITSRLVSSDEEKMWKHVIEEVNAGNQVYVVTPSIEKAEDEEDGVSLQETLPKIKKKLKGVAIGVVHGRLKSKDKTQALEDFRQKKISVLLATTVIEVGVDIPDATIMIILGAERFGLAQLHQLRGRIGRSNKVSYCYAVPSSKSSNSMERLKAFVSTNDGFVLAEKDLELRGAGNIFGDNQSGLPDFKYASWGDLDLIRRVEKVLQELMAENKVTQKMNDHIHGLLDAVHLE